MVPKIKLSEFDNTFPRWFVRRICKEAMLFKKPMLRLPGLPTQRTPAGVLPLDDVAKMHDTPVNTNLLLARPLSPPRRGAPR